MTDNWYQMSGEAVAKRLESSKEDGLSKEKARAHRKKYKDNLIYPVSKITFYQCLKSMTMDYTSYLLMAVALVAALFEENIDAWMIAALVILNLAATVYAYTKSQKMLESMDRYTLPVVRVIRGGRLVMMEQKHLVPGDLICLSRGDIVPADARLLRAENLWVDETYLFGDSPLRSKTTDEGLHETLPPEKQINMLFASTLIVSGEARAMVCETGENTVVCLTDKNRPIINHETMPILGVLGKISRVWSLVVISFVFLISILEFFLTGIGNTFLNSFLSSLSFAVSTMSEMYVAFGYLVLACAVSQSVLSFRENDSRGAIIKNPLCMERLNRLSCLILPKEGVLSTHDSVAEKVLVGSGLYNITERRFRRMMERPILYAILSTGMYGISYLEGKNGAAYTEEETSILNMAKSMDVYNVRLDNAYPMLEHRSRGGDSFFDTTLVRHKDQRIAISRGEPEALLTNCSYYFENGKILILTPQIRTLILANYRKLVRQTYSVVGVASRSHGSDNLRYVRGVQTDMVFEGLIAFRTPYLRGAAQLISDAEEAGIKIILLSEHPSAAEAYFAKQMGIIEGREHCADGTELRKMRESIRRTNASYYRLYCGLDIDQKKELFGYLRNAGETIGFVGQRMEDLELLRRADVSFTQNIVVQAARSAGKSETVVSKASRSAGEEGCEALKFEADVLVSDADRKGNGGLRAILDTIRISKRTDIQFIRMVRYLLASQTARFLLFLYTILFTKEGMSPTQILFSGLIMDFMAVLILSFQKPESAALRSRIDAVTALAHPLKSNIPSVLSGVIWACAAMMASFFSEIFGLTATPQQTGSVLFLTAAICQIIFLFSSQRDEFLWKPGIRFSAMAGLYLLSLIEIFVLFFLFPEFGALFGIVPFDWKALAVMLLFGFVMMITVECVKILTRMREHPEVAAEEAKNGEHRSELAELFHAFRRQKEQEEQASETELTPTDAVKTNSSDSSSAVQDSENTSDAKEPNAADVKKTHNSPLTEVLSAFRESGKEETPNPSKTEADHAEKQKESAKKPKKTDSSNVHKAKKHGLFHSLHEMDMEGEEGMDTPSLLAEDDALLEALRMNHAESPKETTLAEKDIDELLPALPPELDSVPPDQEAYAAAEANGVTGQRFDSDITMEGSALGLREFLRGTEHSETPSDDDTEKEFPGLGYLFSDEQYEAIMAEYSQEDGHKNLYDRDTQAFTSAPASQSADKTKK